MMRKNNGNEKIEQMAELKVNRKYKDTVFRMLFSDKERLLELYNAVSGKNYNNADELEIVTLENAVYMGMKNDLAFLLNMNIYLYEHQSTVNPNMPLRDLFYITSEFSELVELKSLYSSALIKLPTPNFVVFYNGDIEIGDVSEYRLSDSYMTSVEEPALELRVTVLNVNYGKNVKLMEQCESLKEILSFIKYKQETGSLDDGVKLAIEHCINEGILEDFLRKNRSEVEMTSIFEYNKEEEDRKLYEAGVEQGIEKGIEKGVKQTKRKVACSLMKENMPLDKIASIIDVGVKELEKWKTEME